MTKHDIMRAMKILTVTCDDLTQINEYYEAGADEVILPLEDGCFTAMHEFSLEEILEVCKNRKDSQRRIAVLMNRLFFEEERAESMLKLRQLLPYVDAVLFADAGLLSGLSEEECRKMIYRPETLMTSSNDAAWWMGNGLLSVQISPLLTKEEIIEIAKTVKGCSLQIHGRMLMSVSRRPLLSAYSEFAGIESLHEKKGLLLREDQRQDMMPVYENRYGTMIFTDFVQESFADFKDFADAGIERFEIDTMTLEKEAVIDALHLYKAMLNNEEADYHTYLEKYKKYPFSTGYYGMKTIK